MNSLKSQKTLTVKGLLVLMLALAVVSIAAPFASAAAGDVNIIIRAETDADGKGLQLIDANINIRCEGLAVDGNSKASIAGGPGVAYASFALLTDMGGTATESSCADNDRIDVNIRFNRGLKGFISLDTNFTYDTAADPNYFDVNEDRSLSSVTGAGIKFKLKAIVKNELGTSLTGPSLDRNNFAGVDANIATADGNWYWAVGLNTVRGNLQLGHSVAGAIYVDSNATHVALRDVNVDSNTSQTTITFAAGEDFNNDKGITAGSNDLMKGIEFPLKAVGKDELGNAIAQLDVNQYLGKDANAFNADGNFYWRTAGEAAPGLDTGNLRLRRTVQGAMFIDSNTTNSGLNDVNARRDANGQTVVIFNAANTANGAAYTGANVSSTTINARGLEYPLKVIGVIDELANDLNTDVNQYRGFDYNKVALNGTKDINIYFGVAGNVADGNGRLFIAKTGYVDSNATNSGLNDVNADVNSGKAQTRLTFRAADAAGGAAVTAGCGAGQQDCNARGLEYRLKVIDLQTELGRTVDGNIGAIDRNDFNGLNVRRVTADRNFYWEASDAHDGNLRIGGRNQDRNLIDSNVTNAALKNVKTKRSAQTRITFKTAAVAGGSANSGSSITAGSTDQNARGLEYPLKVVFKDELGTAVTAADANKFNQQDANVVTSDGNWYWGYFSLVTDINNLGFQKAGFIDSNATNYGHVGAVGGVFTDNEAGQTIITFKTAGTAGSSANTAACAAGKQDCNARGLEYGLKAVILDETGRPWFLRKATDQNNFDSNIVAGQDVNRTTTDSNFYWTVHGTGLRMDLNIKGFIPTATSNHILRNIDVNRNRTQVLILFTGRSTRNDSGKVDANDLTTTVAGIQHTLKAIVRDERDTTITAWDNNKFVGRDANYVTSDGNWYWYGDGVDNNVSLPLDNNYGGLFFSKNGYVDSNVTNSGLNDVNVGGSGSDVNQTVIEFDRNASARSTPVSAGTSIEVKALEFSYEISVNGGSVTGATVTAGFNNTACNEYHTTGSYYCAVITNEDGNKQNDIKVADGSPQVRTSYFNTIDRNHNGNTQYSTNLNVEVGGSSGSGSGTPSPSPTPTPTPSPTPSTTPTPTPSPTPTTPPAEETASGGSTEAGETAEVTYTETAVVSVVSSISVTTSSAVASVEVSVTVDPTTKPSLNPAGKVFKYLEITPKGFTTAAVQTAKVQFKVEKAWTTANKVDPAKIALNRFADDAWTKLPTTMVKEDATYYYYEATTPGFSTFAISGEPTAEVQPTCGNGFCESGESSSNCCGDCGCPSGQSCQSGSCVTTPTPPTPGPTPSEGEGAMEEKKPEAGDNTGLIIAVIVLLVLAGAYYYFTQMQGKKKGL